MLKRLLIPGLALVFFQGCGGGQGRSTLLHSPLGPELKALWDVHGGLPQWENFAGASLDYEGSGSGKLAPAGKVSCRVIIEFGPPPSVFLLQEQSAAPSGRGEKLATSFLENLFHLPFALNDPGWKFRRAMVLQAGNEPIVEFEATQPGSAHEIGPFLFRYPQLTGGLPGAHYFSRNPTLGSGVYRVEFHGYKMTQGILASTTRKHFAISHTGNTFPPLEMKPFSPLAKQGAALLWTEKLSNLRFLKPEELEAALGQKSQAPLKD